MKKINLRKTKTIIVIVTSAAIVLSASSNYGSTSAFFPREQHNDIFIYSDSLFTFENGVRSGNGTQNNPYMISTWDVDEIKIINTSKNFKIWNCEIDKVIIKDVEWISNLKTSYLKITHWIFRTSKSWLEKVSNLYMVEVQSWNFSTY